MNFDEDKNYTKFYIEPNTLEPNKSRQYVIFTDNQGNRQIVTSSVEAASERNPEGFIPLFPNNVVSLVGDRDDSVHTVADGKSLLNVPVAQIMTDSHGNVVKLVEGRAFFEMDISFLAINGESKENSQWMMDYTITRESALELHGEGFDLRGFPNKFSDLLPNAASLRRLGYDGIDLEKLELPFPPKHPEGADLMRGIFDEVIADKFNVPRLSDYTNYEIELTEKNDKTVGEAFSDAAVSPASEVTQESGTTQLAPRRAKQQQLTKEEFAFDKAMAALAELGIVKDLSAMAKKGELKPTIGRMEEIKTSLMTLAKKERSNPVLVGDAGVGKTQIAEGVAQVMADNKIENLPERLAKGRVFQVDMGAMIAGTKYRGEFEARLKSLISAVEGVKGKYQGGNVVLFMDELHNLVGAGSAEGATDAANIIKPFLNSFYAHVIGATTTPEYDKYIAKDKALARRFQKVHVAELNAADTLEVLKGNMPSVMEHHGIKAAPAEKDIKYVINQAMKLMPEQSNPGKEEDIIGDAMVRAEFEGRNEITLEDLQRSLANKTNLPLARFTSKELEVLKDLPQKLADGVIGQPGSAVVAKHLLANALGMTEPNKPRGVFLIAGSTGIGKTELAKVLNANINEGREIIRIDMGEYMEPHSVAKLIGAPPGYVGHDDLGSETLYDQVRRNPYAVIVFDEIEKAHQDVYNALLAIFEEGKVKDAHGRTVSFENTVIINTSNIGVEALEAEYKKIKSGKIRLERDKSGKLVAKEDKGIGYGSSSSQTATTVEDKRAIAEYMQKKLIEIVKESGKFKPEFLNRLSTDPILFLPLDMDPELRQYFYTATGVADPIQGKRAIDVLVSNNVDAMKGRLDNAAEKMELCNVSFEIDDRIKEQVLKKSYEEGGKNARTLKRDLGDLVSIPVATWLTDNAKRIKALSREFNVKIRLEALKEDFGVDVSMSSEDMLKKPLQLSAPSR